MKKTFLLSIFAFSILTLAACSGGAAPSLIGEWTLVSYGDASNPTPAMPDVETSITFDENGQFGGTMGCNSFNSEYTVDGNQITFGSIVSTMMFCAETSEQETAVLGILTDQTIAYQVNGDQLTLTSADASVVLLAHK